VVSAARRRAIRTDAEQGARDMSFQGSDRRKAQRVDARLRMDVRLPRTDGGEELASLETLNISSAGVYFRCDHFVEPMTKLAMELELTVPAESGGPELELALVPCEGLVVRVDPEQETPGQESYEVAVFFTGIDPTGQIALEKHIALLLETS
jgi:hypothetical protein